MSEKVRRYGYTPICVHIAGWAALLFAGFIFVASPEEAVAAFGIAMFCFIGSSGLRVLADIRERLAAQTSQSTPPPS